MARFVNLAIDERTREETGGDGRVWRPAREMIRSGTSEEKNRECSDRKIRSGLEGERRSHGRQQVGKVRGHRSGNDGGARLIKMEQCLG